MQDKLTDLPRRAIQEIKLIFAIKMLISLNSADPVADLRMLFKSDLFQLIDGCPMT